MNRLFKYLLIAFGECLLIAVLFLLFPEGETELFALNAIALSIAYLANTLGYPTFFRRPNTDDNAGYGIAWLGIWLYTAAVVVSAAIFFWFQVPLVWQVLAQCLWLLLFLTSAYLSGQVSRYAGSLERRHQSETAGIGQLKDRARMLQASVPAGLGEGARKALTEVTERTGYLTASRSPLAATLEQEIMGLLASMEQILGQPCTPATDSQVEELAQRCTLALKKRMALPY